MPKISRKQRRTELLSLSRKELVAIILKHEYPNYTPKKKKQSTNPNNKKITEPESKESDPKEFFEEEQKPVQLILRPAEHSKCRESWSSGQKYEDFKENHPGYGTYEYSGPIYTGYSEYHYTPDQLLIDDYHVCTLLLDQSEVWVSFEIDILSAIKQEKFPYELSAAKKALQSAKKGVSRIGKNRFDKLKTLKHVKKEEEVAVMAVCVLMGKGKTLRNWKDICKLMKEQDLFEDIMTFKSKGISGKMRQKVHDRYLTTSEFEDQSRNKSKIAQALFFWIVASINLSRLLEGEKKGITPQTEELIETKYKLTENADEYQYKYKIQRIGIQNEEDKSYNPHKGTGIKDIELYLGGRDESGNAKWVLLKRICGIQNSDRLQYFEINDPVSVEEKRNLKLNKVKLKVLQNHGHAKKCSFKRFVVYGVH